MRMMRSLKRVAVTMALSVLGLAANTSNAAATVFDLSADWLDGPNPNGPWSYREGDGVLPFDPSWTTGVNFPVIQPAYHPGDRLGNFLPAWYKATSVPVGFDIVVGDVIAYSNDSFNGFVGLGEANVLFTVPFAGLFTISGEFWDAAQDHPDRPQEWAILVNRVNDADGLLSGTVTRAAAQTVNITNLLLNAGDKIELVILQVPMAVPGYFVGTALTITGTPTGVPEPNPIYIVVLSLAWLGFFRWRRTA
jgi:hypothetical protein